MQSDVVGCSILHGWVGLMPDAFDEKCYVIERFQSDAVLIILMSNAVPCGTMQSDAVNRETDSLMSSCRPNSF